MRVKITNHEAVHSAAQHVALCYGNVAMSAGRLASALRRMSCATEDMVLRERIRSRICIFTQKKLAYMSQHERCAHKDVFCEELAAGEHAIFLEQVEEVFDTKEKKALAPAQCFLGDMVKVLTENAGKTPSTEVITGMAAFVRNQILTQSTVVIRGQSTVMPRMALHLLAS